MPRPRRDAGSGAPRALAVDRTGAGPRLVLVHGFTQTGRSWRRIATDLSRHHEVLTVDLPGHGRSADVGVRDLPQAGRLVAAAGGEATYVGYSMGGRVALHAAFSCPGSVRRLVLVGAHPGIADLDERAVRRRADDALASRLEATGKGRLTIDAFLAEWLAAPPFAHLERSAAGLAARRENTTDGLARALRTLGTGTQDYDAVRLHRLAMPVLIVAGGLDRPYSRLGRRLAGTIGANATFRSIPGVGHAAPFEAPLLFAEILASWLTSPGAP
ncbi:MAG TPA: alpha/beta fold hydrolase [Acidimicrobiales bacterium]|nr:alpha/beta fold hydrolase [Acidimicrobiales bacterium]